MRLLLDANPSPSLIVGLSDAGFEPLHIGAIAGATKPSVVQLRGVGELASPAHLASLVANLDAVADDLEAGALVSLS